MFKTIKSIKVYLFMPCLGKDHFGQQIGITVYLE